jgi:ABC-type multidrug transport system fused ATPase/permease subunit
MTIPQRGPELTHPSIPNCAASISIFRNGPTKGYIRLFLIAIWATLFTAYVGVFLSRLQKWDPVHCYKTSAIALPASPHPRVDTVYVSITLAYILFTFCCALFLSLALQFKRVQKFQQELYNHVLSMPISPFVRQDGTPMSVPATQLQYYIPLIAMLQCPLHIYSIFALHASNERYLEEGAEEREWGFGQIAAIVLLGGNLLQVIDGVASMLLSPHLDCDEG